MAIQHKAVHVAAEDQLEELWREIMVVLIPFFVTASTYEKVKQLFLEGSKIQPRARLIKNLRMIQRRIEAPENQLDMAGHGKVIKVTYLRSFIEETLHKNQYD